MERAPPEIPAHYLSPEPPPEPPPSLKTRIGMRAGRFLLGAAFTRMLEEMKQAQWLPPHELHPRAEARLTGLLRHAAVNVPFYSDLWRSQRRSPHTLIAREDLRRVPVVDKELFRSQPLERFLAGNVPPHRRLDYTTSGSTGEPLRFCLDRAAQPLVFASHLFYDSWFDLKPFDRYVRFMAPPAAEAPPPAGAPLRFRLRQAAGARLQRLYERLTQRRFSMWDVDPDGVQAIWQKLRSFRPAYVLGYTSTLATLAAELAARDLALGLPLKAVITIAEPLTPPRRRLIESYFQAPVVNRYGQREFKYWAAQSCAEGPDRFHVNTELVLPEVLRADGSPAAPGEVGRLVLSNLHNEVMPFIRYDTQDLAALDTAPCPCGRGFPLLVRLEGRSQEVLETPSGRMVNPTSLGHFLFVVKDWVDRINHYQLVVGDGAATLLVVPAGPLDGAARQRLENDLAELLKGELAARVEVVRAIPLERSGKRPVIRIAAASAGSAADHGRA